MTKRPDEISRSSPLAPRVLPTRPAHSRWYTVGAGAAGGFALGALLVMLGDVARKPGCFVTGVVVLSGAALVLGVAWLVTLRRDVGGILPALGCLAVPISTSPILGRDPVDPETATVVLGVGFASFVGGHLFARGVNGIVRASAAATLGVVILAFAAGAGSWHVAWLATAHEIAFGALAWTAMMLSIDLALIAEEAVSVPLDALAGRSDRRHAP